MFLFSDQNIGSIQLGPLEIAHLSRWDIDDVFFRHTRCWTRSRLINPKRNVTTDRTIYNSYSPLSNVVSDYCLNSINVLVNRRFCGVALQFWSLTALASARPARLRYRCQWGQWLVGIFHFSLDYRMIAQAIIDEGTYSLTWDLNYGGSLVC
jgi:hypothetical protein